MAPLTDWELAAARDAMEVQTLDQTCDIRRASGADDDYGGVSTATTVVHEDVPARIHSEPLVGRYAQGIEGFVPLFLVSLKYGVDVRAQDQLDFGSIVLVVTRLLEPETWGLVTQVEASTGSR